MLVHLAPPRDIHGKDELEHQQCVGGRLHPRRSRTWGIRVPSALSSALGTARSCAPRCGAPPLAPTTMVTQRRSSPLQVKPAATQGGDVASPTRSSALSVGAAGSGGAIPSTAGINFLKSCGEHGAAPRHCWCDRAPPRQVSCVRTRSSENWLPDVPLSDVGPPCLQMADLVL